MDPNVEERSAPATPAEKPKKTYPNPLAYLWAEWIRPTIEAVVIALVITTFLVTTVGVQGQSDTPTVLDGERVLIPKYEIWLHKLGIGRFQRGDLVVLKPPVGAPQDERPIPLVGNLLNLKYRPFFIKRIVAVPGDKVRVNHGQLYVNDLKVDESHTTAYWKKQGEWDTESYLASTPEKDLTLGKDQYFVMGDNRSAGGSEDSRVFGPVKSGAIAGRAVFVLWPPPLPNFGKSDLHSPGWRVLGRPAGFQALNARFPNNK